VLPLPILKGRVVFHLCDVYLAIHDGPLMELLWDILGMVQEQLLLMSRLSWDNDKKQTYVNHLTT